MPFSKMPQSVRSGVGKSKKKQKSWMNTYEGVRASGGSKEKAAKIAYSAIKKEVKLSFMKILEDIEKIEGKIMADNKKGKMIAFFSPISNEMLGLDLDNIEGEEVPVEERHITLGLLHGDEEEDKKLQSVLKDLSAQMRPIKPSVSRLGVFPPNEHNHGKYVLYAKPSDEELKQIHDFIFAALQKHKIPIDNGSFDFSPHITLKYCENDPSEILSNVDANIPLENISLASGGKKYHFKMGGY